MNNIILIGMPGSGKSSLGVVLAKKIGFGFIDSDLVIQQREGMTLERIIEKHGDAGFIQIENEVNCSISPHHTVIATGGSAVYGKRQWNILRILVLWFILNFHRNRSRKDLEALKSEALCLMERQQWKKYTQTGLPYIRNMRI